MISLSDFFPGGKIRFVPPPFDEKYWAYFGIPATCCPSRWGAELQRGLAYKDMGAPSPSGTRGVVRKISSGRKERGMSSSDYKG